MGCLIMVLGSILLSVLCTVGANLAIRWSAERGRAQVGHIHRHLDVVGAARGALDGRFADGCLG
jgi:hypothetical protein